MLEEHALLILPWAPPPRTAAPGPRLGGRVELRRSILAPWSRQFLGCAQRRSRAWFPGFSWLARPLLEVVETEDESLLCRLCSDWGIGNSSQVRDADDRLVGRLRANA